MSGKWFTTQGGGKAVEGPGTSYVWAEPPKEFPEMKIGDPIPEEWSVVGPFDGDGQIKEERDWDIFGSEESYGPEADGALSEARKALSLKCRL